MKLKYQWPLVWSLVFLLPFCDCLALPAGGGSPLQHLLWPLVHANILHWFINTFCFMALWRMVTVPRLLWAYAASIIIGYLWSWCSVPAGFVSGLLSVVFISVPAGFASGLLSVVSCPLSNYKLCGLSGIIFFLLGILFTRCTRTYRIRLTILIIISCFIPNIAASVHILSILSGILYAKLSVLWHRHNSSRPIIFYSVAAGFVSGLLSVVLISVPAGFASGLLSVVSCPLS